MSSPAVALEGTLPTTRDAGDAALTSAGRIRSIDVLRGIVIALMALDHVRDYFTNARFDPLDLEQTDPALFATRWVTHFCAPIFVFLAGTSAYLMSLRLSRRELSGFLFKRGLWLVILELTVVNWAWTFRIDYEFGIVLQVIWAIGISMIVLAALVHLPVAAVGAFGVLLIAAHNLLDGVGPDRFGALAPLWMLFHVQGPTPFAFVAYPLIPWIGVMAAGYALGIVYTWSPARRVRTLVLLGLAAIGLFVALRLAHGYGDPGDWEVQRNALWSVLDFFDVRKYPPSLLYLAITLGPGLLALAALERARGALAAGLETFGRVPLFAYVVHIALAHLLAGLLGLALGFGPIILNRIFFAYPPEWGFGLVGVYVAWAVVLALLYPMCRWFANLKQRRRDWWLSYL